MFDYLSRCSQEEILGAACALRRFASEPVEQSVAHSLPRQMGGFGRHSQQGTVLKAMQHRTEIVLPKTYDQLVLNAGVKAKRIMGKKTKNTQLMDKLAPEQAAKWKEMCDRTWENGVSAWDNAIATLPLIQGNVIMRSKDKRIVCIKMNGGLNFL